MLFNPAINDFEALDPRSREIMQKTIEFFETKGKVRLKEDDYQRRWYRDFLDFVRENRIFSTLLTPPEHEPELCAQRDPRLLRTPLLVRLAGHHPRPRAAMDGRRTGDQGTHRSLPA